ncbi:MAG: right-handed parallel beta-helix repeat-containing protein, partial [Candidatus Thermoplasmatota archaeon]
DGSIGNPYIIEDYDINASSANGIEIRNTDVYFVIRNSTVHDGRSNLMYGIYLHNVTNGKIQNVGSYNNCVGIYFVFSSNNSITSNRIYDSSDGIRLDHSSHTNIISSNQIYNNSYSGILLSESSNNNITANQIYNNPWGIFFTTASLDNNITSNRIYNNSNDGIWLDDSSNNNIVSSNQIYDNNHSGIYLSEASNNNITSNLIYNNNHGIQLYESSNNNIGTNQIHNKYNGVLLFLSLNNHISTNQIYNNNYHGISLSDSSNNNITTNQIHDNEDGIWLYNSSNTNLSANQIYDNSGRGIYLWLSSNNTLNANQVYNNGDGIFLSSSSNATLKNNILEDNNYNFGVIGEDISDYYHDIDTLNKINGKPIYYIIEKNNLIFDCIFVGFLALISCTNISVKNLTLTNNHDGLLLANSSYLTISANRIHNNRDGISLFYSSNNDLSSNQICNNRYGVYLDYSPNNDLNSNQIYNNGNGVYLRQSSGNDLSLNQIYDNYVGIELSTSTNNKIHYNNIYSNTYYGVYNYDSDAKYVANAAYNWWGSVDGPSGEGPGTGDEVNRNVIYYPWLIEPLVQDLTFPTIIQTSPTNDEIDVPVDKDIVITFSEPMNILTIPGNITMEPRIDIKNYLWSNNNTTLTLILNSNLSSYIEYTITLNINIADSGIVMDSIGVVHFIGNHLKEAYRFSFRTKDITPPIPNAGYDIVVDEDIEIELNASLSLDNVGIVSYTWSFIDQGMPVHLYGEIAKYIFTQPGYYIVTLNVSDVAGNWAVDILNITVKDITPPVIMIISPDDGMSTNQNITLIYLINDNVDSLEELGIIGPANGTVYRDEGNYTITLTARDRANNLAEKTIFFIIDKTAPSINVKGVIDGAYYNINVTPVIKIKDANPNISSITLNAYPLMLGTTITEEGNYILTVLAIDKAGNSARKEISFTIDKTPPAATSNIKFTRRTENSITLTWDKNEDKDFNRYELWQATKKDFSDALLIANITDVNSTTYTIANLSEGTRYYFKIKVVDNAGNEAYSDIVSVATLKKEMIGTPWLLIWVLVIMIMAVTVVAVMLYTRKKM